MAAATSVHVVTIIEPIIQHADWFFPEDLDFNVSGMFAPMTPANHLNNLPLFGNEYDSSTLERKRPVSVAAVEDMVKKDSPSKSKEPAGTPPPVRNDANTTSAGVSPSQQTGTGPTQLNVAAGSNTTGPSPHVIRRATKKPAPAPPKPTNPPPGQPAGHGTNQPASQASVHSPKQPNQVASPSQSQPGNWSPVQSHGQSVSQPTIQPRRHSSNLMVIHAPSHPPPQPPAQPINPYPCKAPSDQVTDQSSHSPPDTPTPPSTPPLGTHNTSFHLNQHFPHGQVSTASQDLQPQHSLPPQFATLPRARPVPKPRNRPSVPPPPQPAVTAPATNCSSPPEHALPNVATTASKIVTGLGGDSAARF